MTYFKDDKELFQFIRKFLHVASVCDILDEAGYRNQAMHQRLRPLLTDIYNCGFVGRAKTFHWIETNAIEEDDPYGLEIEAMDSLKAGDVVVHSTDYNGTNAPWGELMSTISKNKGVAGCVCDSQVRDCVKIIEMNFPVFYAGIRPLDSKGRGHGGRLRCADTMRKRFGESGGYYFFRLRRHCGGAQGSGVGNIFQGKRESRK